VREQDELAAAVLDCLAAAWPHTPPPVDGDAAAAAAAAAVEPQVVEMTVAVGFVELASTVRPPFSHALSCEARVGGSSNTLIGLVVVMVVGGGMGWQALAHSSDSSAATTVHRAAVDALQALAEGAAPPLLAALLPVRTSPSPVRCGTNGCGCQRLSGVPCALTPHMCAVLRRPDPLCSWLSAEPSRTLARQTFDRKRCRYGRSRTSRTI
jgi:hypothetical protein